MKAFLVFGLFMLSIISKSNAQENLPYYEIPAYPDSYTAGTVAARVIDGLGFRYYWATEGLRLEDLAFKPGVEARTIEETLVHIYQLSLVIINTIQQVPTSGSSKPEMTFPYLRKETLENLFNASVRLKACTENELAQFKIIFTSNTGTSEFPFWNLLNGPIDDALWHVGQVVTFRRSSGNPINPDVSVLTGKVKAQSSAQVEGDK